MIETLRAGIGTSELDDATLAGQQAARQAVDQVGGGRADLMLVFSSVRYDLPALLAAINEVSGAAPLVGATSCGQMHHGELTPPGRGLTVLALAGGYRFGVARVTHVRDDPIAAGQQLARSARQAARAAGAEQMPYHALIVLSDGLIADSQGLLDGVHRVTGLAVPVVGGAAADDRRQLSTSVFYADEVRRNAAVGVWVGARRPVAVALGTGWRPVGLPQLLTSVDGSVIKQIGGRPAVAVYREQTGADRPGGPFPTYLGLIEPDGTLLMRAAFLGADGELHTFTPLPVYSAVRFVQSRPDDLLSAAEQAVSTVLEGRRASAVLAFSCAARLDVLGERGPEEAKRVQAAAGSVPVCGCYTYGEFARTASVVGYHNATVAVVAL